MEVINEFQRKRLNRGLFACICSFFILFVVVLVLLLRIPHPEIQPPLSKQQQQLSQQLNSIETHLNNLSTQINKSKTVNPVTVEALSQQLNAIQQGLTNLNQQNNFKNLQTTLENSQQAMVEKLQSLQKNLQQLKQRLSPQVYLPLSTLPFKVISIDIWNGEPEATIMIDGNATLMAKSDTYAGWTLTDISFDPACAIFLNNHHQLVKVNF